MNDSALDLSKKLVELHEKSDRIEKDILALSDGYVLKARIKVDIETKSYSHMGSNENYSIPINRLKEYLIAERQKTYEEIDKTIDELRK